MRTSLTSCAATSSRVNSGSNFRARPLTPASILDARPCSPISIFAAVLAILPWNSAARWRRRAPASTSKPEPSSASSSWTSLSGEPDRQPADDRNVHRARLRSVQAYMDAHLSDPSLSLSAIARKNGISLRYLHQLFRLTDMSASEWLRLRRLQRCHDILSSPAQATRSITEIAYSMGFGSSSHFSNLFRAQFGRRPSDVRAASVVSSLSRMTVSSRIKARPHFGTLTRAGESDDCPHALVAS